MSEFVVTDPSGKEFVVNAPEGATQDQALAYAQSQFGQQASQPQPRPSIGDYASGAAKAVGSEFMGGLQDVSRAASSLPFGQGATSDYPSKAFNAVGDTVMGLLRSSFSPTQAIAKPGEMVAERVATEAGASPEWASRIGSGTNAILSLLAPQGLVNAIPNAISKAATPLGRVLKAEQGNQALADIRQAESKIAVPGADLTTIRSPLAESMGTGGKRSAIYDQFNDIANRTYIDSGDIGKRAQELANKFGAEAIPGAMQPTKAVKVAEAIPESLAVGAAAEKGVNYNEFLTDFRAKLQASEGRIKLADAQTEMKGLAGMMKSSDSRIRETGSQLYKEFEATLGKTPEGRTLLGANKEWRQNAAAADIGEMITGQGVSKFENGVLSVNADALQNKLKAMTPEAKQFMRESFPPDEWKKLTDTLENVFQLRGKAGFGGGKLPDVIKPETPKPVNHLTRVAVSGMLGSLAHALGVPGGALTGMPAVYAASYIPQVYTKLIIKAATFPMGRQLLQRLYQGAPPGLADAAKAAALMRFLRANGSQSGSSAAQGTAQ